MASTWTLSGAEIILQNDRGPSKCDGVAKYKIAIDKRSGEDSMGADREILLVE
ncbi:MAG: hypothetical protein ABI024_00085 [Vicinamibacterales bacterium]